MLDPGIYRNARLAALPPLAHILFEGLWCMADRQGRSLGEPRAIIGSIFTFRRDVDEATVTALLDALEAPPGGFIKRYQADGKDLIWIPSFGRYQRPHRREKASVLPPHPDDTAVDFAPRKPKASRGTVLGPVPGKPSAGPRPAKGRRNTELLDPPVFSSPAEKRIQEAAPPPAAKAGNWLAGYLDDWRTIRGGNMAKPGAAAGALDDIHKRYGEERAREGWRKYLHARRDKEASPVWFAQDAARWCGPAPLPAELQEGGPSLRGWLKPPDWQDDRPAYGWECDCAVGVHGAFDRALDGTCPVKLGLKVDRNGYVVAA